MESDLCYMCFSTGTLEHMMIKCCYFTQYLSILKQVFSALGYGNLVFNLKTLVCGYKISFKEYTEVNLLLCLIFFVIYKCWLIIYTERKYLNPIQLLVSEIEIRKKLETNNFRLFEMFFDMLKIY